MNFQNFPIFKEIRNVSAGELIVLEFYGTRTLAIVLLQGDSGTTIGILSCGEPKFVMTHMTTDFDSSGCFSYDTDWDIELIQDKESYLGNQSHRLTEGTIHVGPDDTSLCLKSPPESQSKSVVHFRFNKQKPGTLDREAMPILNWNIWRLPRTERDVPLFSWP